MKKYEKYRHNVDFIREYSQASNAATGSKFDSNANIETKNVTTLSCEIHKEADIGINRLRMIDKITELYGTELAEKYIEQLDSHQIYRHDETHPVFPYCVSITMYPFICEGLKSIGAPSTEPKNLQSFAGNFINLVFAISAQFAGAVATPEFLTYLDHFIRLEYGDDYYEKTDVIVNPISKRPKTLEKVIDDIFEQIVYSINEPAAARNFQSVFWNIAYFDHTYFNAIFEDFVFPDGDEPKWESVSWLQKHFMEWFNNERLRNYLTFPVETVNLVYDKESKQYIDKEWADFTAEMWSKGHSFFCYNSDSADSLSSCCRLKNGITDNVFSYTLGAGGISTGSKAVITINVNRLVQDVKKKSDKNNLDFNIELDKAIRSQVDDIHKYLNAFNEILKDEQSSGLLPIINGLVEGAEFLGIEVTPNTEYFNYCKSILAPIQEENKKARTDEIMFNTEYVPAENLGVKNAEWDRKAGYYVPRDCYNSYFFKVEDQELSVLDKMILHGQQVVQYLDGGSACHLNLEEHLDKTQYRALLDIAAKIGCSYLTFNIPNTVCNKCGHISKHKEAVCEKCGSTDLDYITRVIGYAKRVSKYSEARQKEARRRVYNAKRNVFARN